MSTVIKLRGVIGQRAAADRLVDEPRAVGGVLAIAIRKFMIIVSTSWSGATPHVTLAARLFGCHDEKYLLIPELVLMAFGIWFQYWTAPKQAVAAQKSETEPAPPETAAGS